MLVGGLQSGIRGVPLCLLRRSGHALGGRAHLFLVIRTSGRSIRA